MGTEASWKPPHYYEAGFSDLPICLEERVRPSQWRGQRLAFKAGKRE